MTLTVVEFVQKPLTDVPGQLRALADRIEAGEYGDLNDPEFILRVALVLRASGLEPAVFAWGALDVGAATAFMDLHAGAAELMSMRSPGR